MKRILSVTVTLAFSFFLLSSFSIRENPQDPPLGKKKEKHIKIVKTDDNGNKIELDTIVEGDGIFVWNGDTIDDGKELKWITNNDFTLDSLHKNKEIKLEYVIKDGDDGKVLILKSGKLKGNPMIYEFNSDDDSTKTYKIEIIGDDDTDDDVMMWHGKKGPGHMLVAPRPVRVPQVPQLMFGNKKTAGNIIDLSDPGIISFKKRELRGGREKITIIRKKPDKKNEGKPEEINLPGVGDTGMLTPKAPVKAQRIKVIKNDGEDIKVIKDEKVLHPDSGDEDVKVIKKDGKIIRITENKKGGEKQVVVNVKVETEKENK